MENERTQKLGLTKEDVQSREEGPGIAGLFAAMGDEAADAQAIASAPDGIKIAERMAVMSMPEDSEASRNYWLNEDKGLIKTLHGEGLDKWSLFVPKASSHAPGRKFPLIFCLHGAHNPIQLTESYGVVQVAAREECIVIAPENENTESIDALYEYAVSSLPVDTSRVYLMGYSFGGFMSSRNGLSNPGRYAGVAMGGMLFAGNVRGHELDGQNYGEFILTEEMVQRAADLGLPAFLFMGENEMLRLLPLWREPARDVRDGVIPLSSRDKQKALQVWRRVGGCGPCAMLKQGEGENEVERSIGARFERVETRAIDGRRYFLGDSVTSQGECLFRTVAAERMVHWPTPAFAELAWEHVSQFSRNQITGELIRNR